MSWESRRRRHMEAARERVREFINAGKTSEVVFTRNSTESLNLIAYSYGLTSLKAGDEILISIDNHHSNILPWQMVSRQTGAKLVYLECQPDGSYRDEDMEAPVTEKTKIAAMPQISNVLGRRNPVEKLTKLVHEKAVSSSSMRHRAPLIFRWMCRHWMQISLYFPVTS